MTECLCSLALPENTSTYLSISPNGKNFRLNGNPIYWFADTAWKLSEKVITKEEMTAYLEDRNQKGIKIIQGPRIFTQETFPLLWNAEQNALINSGFEFIDHAIAEAGRLGIILAIPLFWGPDNDYLFPEVAKQVEVVKNVVSRYRNQSHITWVISGEYHKIAYTPAGIVNGIMTWNKVRRLINVEEKARFQALLNAVNESKHPNSLITFHPDGSRSVGEDWQAQPAHRFNMLQPSDNGVVELIKRSLTEYVLTPKKPVVNSECGYEGQEDNPALGPWRQRNYAWYSAFCDVGYTYGHGKIWDFNPGWQEALNSQGSAEVINIFHTFMKSIHKETNTPAKAWVVDPGTPGDNYIAALRNSNSALYVYTATGRNFSIKTDKFKAGVIKAQWFNPRTGVFDTPFTAVRSLSTLFNPPGSPGINNDWVLQLKVV